MKIKYFLIRLEKVLTLLWRQHKVKVDWSGLQAGQSTWKLYPCSPAMSGMRPGCSSHHQKEQKCSNLQHLPLCSASWGGSKCEFTVALVQFSLNLRLSCTTKIWNLKLTQHISINMEIFHNKTDASKMMNALKPL